MKKKILIGSMLVLTLLLLMPSIPAIQQKTIEDREYSDLGERLDDFNFKELFIKKSRGFIPIILTFLIGTIYWFRALRGLLIFGVGGGLSYEGEIKPFFYWRGLWLMVTAVIWISGWQFFYDYMGWN